MKKSIFTLVALIAVLKFANIDEEGLSYLLETRI